MLKLCGYNKMARREAAGLIIRGVKGEKGGSLYNFLKQMSEKLIS